MWEQISSNKRKTLVLVAGMAGVLLTLGFVIGEFYMPGAGIFGLAIAFGIWFIMTTVAWFQGDNIVLMMSGAKPMEHGDHPVLWNVVEEMKIASGLDHMPAVYLVNDMSPNAFAVGRKPEKAAVAVTAGLLGKLNRDELQGVIAHEVGHIVNRDVMLMSMLATMLGTITLVSETFLRSLRHTGSTRRFSAGSKKGGGGGGQAQLIMMAVALIFAILAPIAAQLIYFAVSRKREYLADAQASVFTRYPEGLASALEKISSNAVPVEKASKATAAMYIVNPFAKMSLSGMTATHPPTGDRIAILRSIGNIASYGAYQQAWKSVGGKAVGLPKSSLRSESAAAVREAHAESKTPRQQIREAGDIMRQFNDFVFLSCLCGMRFKIPPNYAHDTIACPKCSRNNPLPAAQLMTASKVLDEVESRTKKPNAPGVRTATPRAAKGSPQEALKVPRGKPGEWHTIKCSCGKPKSFSPSFAAPKSHCNTCHREIIFE